MLRLAWPVLLTVCSSLPALPQENSRAPLARDQQEEFLRKAKAGDSFRLSKGVTNSIRRRMEKDGLRHDAHFQTINIQKARFDSSSTAELNFRDSFLYNIAAYELAKLLGIGDMVPVCVQRSLGGTSGALSWWVDDVIMDETKRLASKTQPPNPDAWNREMDVVRVFDQLIANTDRNLGNILIDKNWRIWMIDHTRAFRTRTTLLKPQNLARCDRALLANMRELSSTVLKSQLGPWLTSMERNGLLARRDEIVGRFEELVKQQGEAAVFFDRPGRD